MSEIDGPKFSVNQVSFNSTKRQQTTDNEPVVEQEQVPQLSDFSNAKGEAIGRSMLFKGTDDVNSDLKAIIEDPQIAANSDELFELTYTEAQRTGMANPYEEAASASTTSFS